MLLGIVFYEGYKLKTPDEFLEVDENLRAFYGSKSFGGGIDTFSIGVLIYGSGQEPPRIKKLSYKKNRTDKIMGIEIFSGNSLEYEIALNVDDYALLTSKQKKAKFSNEIFKSIVSNKSKMEKLENFEFNNFFNSTKDFLEKFRTE